MILPPPLGIIRAAAAWLQKKTPFSLTSTIRAKSSGVKSRAVLWTFTPALLTSMSRPPRSASAVAIIAFTASTSETSTARNVRVTAHLPDLCAGFFRCLAVECGHQHIGARVREREGDPFSQPLTGAGHDRYFAR